MAHRLPETSVTPRSTVITRAVVGAARVHLAEDARGRGKTKCGAYSEFQFVTDLEGAMLANPGKACRRCFGEPQ